MYLKSLRPAQLTRAVRDGVPLLVPAGCVETHGPHMAIGHDTIIVEEVCARVAERVPAVIAPSFDYGPTGYALGGPADGTIDPDYDAFGALAKSVLRNFIEMGFARIYVIIMHQGMDAPLALAFRKGAAELSFEHVLDSGYNRGWWADAQTRDAVDWGRVQVQPLILPAASPPAGGDHAGYFETSMLLAVRPELVDQQELDDNAPWYCRQGEAQNSWTASAAAGAEMVDAMVAAWVACLSADTANSQGDDTP
jgi:creatinine amidohydrolase